MGGIVVSLAGGMNAGLGEELGVEPQAAPALNGGRLVVRVVEDVGGLSAVLERQAEVDQTHPAESR